MKMVHCKMHCYWDIYTLLLVTVILNFTSVSYGSDLFTSTDRLRDLSAIEGRSIAELEQATEKLQQKISLLKSLVKEIKNDNKSVPDESSIISHPVHVYNLVKRWNAMRKLFAVKQVHYDIRSLSNTNKNDFLESVPGTKCVDNSNNCRYWADIGECLRNPKYMLRDCRKSCEVCSLGKVTDHIDPMLDKAFDNFIGKDKNIFPYSSDFDGSAEGIIRLQRTYNLKTEDLIQGNINGYKSVVRLSPEAVIHIGEHAVHIGEWGYGAQWLNKAFELNKNRNKQLDIQLPLAGAYMKMGDYRRASQIINTAAGKNLQDLLSSDCYDKQDDCTKLANDNQCNIRWDYMKNNCKYSCWLCSNTESFPRAHELTNLLFSVNRKIATAGGIEKLEYTPEPNKMRQVPYQGKEKYEQLCRGDRVKQYPSKRVCRYRPAGIPWFVYKEEILNMNPRISMVYDVINDREADMFKAKAKHLMFRALVGKEHRTSNDRVSNVGWLNDDDPDILRFSERVELITGMEVTETAPFHGDQVSISSDHFQVVNYGVGGQYEPHVDYFVGQPLLGTEIGKTVNASGGRIATFLLYLSDIKAGGATVYPRVGVHVPPIKNAAAFWYNSQLSGKYDPLTLHAGCPVLLGEKWVSNKWVREFGNHFKRRCALTKNAKYS